MSANKDKQRRERDKRHKRAARRSSAAAAAATTPRDPSFAEVLERANLIAQSGEVTRTLIARAESIIAAGARKTLQVISCHGCTAPKGCCTVTVMVWLYEAVPIAARLRREGRDTAELREQLRESATLMETLSTYDYNRPCVFLDAAERCTIYDDRPGNCGSGFVSSPAANCSNRDAPITKFPDPIGDATASAEMMFEQHAGLPLLDQPYKGPLPRMVLLCLQAWDRRDYPQYLAERVNRPR